MTTLASAERLPQLTKFWQRIYIMKVNIEGKRKWTTIYMARSIQILVLQSFASIFLQSRSAPKAVLTDFSSFLFFSLCHLFK